MQCIIIKIILITLIIGGQDDAPHSINFAVIKITLNMGQQRLHFAYFATTPNMTLGDLAMMISICDGAEQSWK